MNASKVTYRIAPEIFDIFPGYMRGVVIARGVKNGPSPDELVALLRAAEKDARSKLNLDTIIDHPKMASWREAYRRFGAKPGKFRPSMEAIARRVLREQELPSISRLVDIGNIVSLKQLIPVGGHAIDVVAGDLALRRAVGNESFVPFGADTPESPEAGEIIFSEGETVLTRRWTWRQANHTLVSGETTALEFNVDVLPPVTATEAENACHDIMALTEKFCGGRLHYEILTCENDSITLVDEGR